MKAGWEVRRLGEVTTKIGSGATPRGGKNSYQADGVSLIRSLNIHDLEFRMNDLAKLDQKQADALSNVIVEPRDVLLNITGASIARCAEVPEHVLPARVNQHVSILRPMPDLVDSRFLSYLLVSTEVKDRLLGIGEAGSTRQALTKAQLQEFPIALPPLEEQQRIVAVLDEAFEGLSRARANAGANLQNARELFASYLGQVLKANAAGWSSRSIKTLVSEGILFKPQDGNHGEIHPKKSDFVPAGVPFIMASDLVEGQVDQAGCYFLTRAQADSLRTGFAKDADVLVSHKGTIGRTAILETDLDYVMLTPQVTYYRVRDKERLLPEFLYFSFQSSPLQHQMNSVAQEGATRAYIGITRQLDLTLPIPEISEQKRLVSLFRSAEAQVPDLVAAYSRKVAGIDSLRQSLLQKAFAGELT